MISLRRCVAALSILAVAASLSAAPPERPPDVVLIMADDMGFSDLGCYGGEIETPNLDRLAQEGLRFTNFYCENMCVPSRAALLTGIYTRTSYRKAKLNPRCATIAEALSEHGYATGMTGKWHLGPVGNASALPTSRGFKRFFGTILGAGSFFAPASLMRDDQPAEREFSDPDFYYTDAISDNAVRFVEETAPEKPLFLYVAYTAAHWPLHARPEDIKKYAGRYSEGWDALRERRFERMRELGVIAPEARLSPRDPEVPAWEDASEKAWQQRRMEVYAAQVDVMDQGIGRIVEALRRAGRLDRTLLMFLIDNGGCHVEYTTKRKGPYLPQKTRDGRPMRPGNVPGLMPGPEETYQSYGRGWANASNTPFRLFKQHSHEGGIRTPFIVRWPGRLKKPGGLVRGVAHLIDIMPTVLEAAGAQPPESVKGGPAMSIDGKSLMPLFSGESREGHASLYWQWSKGCAARTGKWKLVRVRQGPWELYDVEADPSELVNLAGKMPDKVAELSEAWEKWSKNTATRN